MGFWYLFILLLGILLLVGGATKKDVSRATKIVTFSFIMGTFLIMIALFMFLPGSAEMLAQLLQLN